LEDKRGYIRKIRKRDKKTNNGNSIDWFASKNTYYSHSWDFKQFNPNNDRGNIYILDWISEENGLD